MKVRPNGVRSFHPSSIHSIHDEEIFTRTKDNEQTKAFYPVYCLSRVDVCSCVFRQTFFSFFSRYLYLRIFHCATTLRPFFVSDKLTDDFHHGCHFSIANAKNMICVLRVFVEVSDALVSMN